MDKAILVRWMAILLRRCGTPRFACSASRTKCWPILTKIPSNSVPTTTRPQKSFRLCRHAYPTCWSWKCRYCCRYGDQHSATQSPGSCRCAIAAMRHPQISFAELLEIIPAPDFPTGAPSTAAAAFTMPTRPAEVDSNSRGCDIEEMISTRTHRGSRAALPGE